MKLLPLRKYLDDNYPTYIAYANEIRASKAQVNQWLLKSDQGRVFIDPKTKKLYSLMRRSY